MAELKTLIRQRGNIKARLTKLCKNVDDLEAEANADLLSIKKDRLNSISKEFDVIQDKIELLVDSADTELDYREEFENTVDQLSAKLIGWITQKRESLSNSVSLSSSLNKKTIPVKLPTIAIPSFQGEFTEWYHFRDTFDSLIVNNEGLSDIQKFHYLLAALRGEAHGLIKNIPITEANFENAYRIICERYNNKRIIVTNHVKCLLNLPSVSKNNPIQLRKLINEVSTNSDAIRALNLEVRLDELLLIQLILDKVDLSTRRKFESSLETEQIATIKSLLMFLEHECQTELVVHNESHQGPLSSLSQSNSRTSYSKPFKTNSMVAATSSSYCLMCKGSHKLHKCYKYTSLSPLERLNRVKEFRLCFNCLKLGHQTKGCSSSILCFKCNKAHHTSLHRETTNNSNKSLPSPSPVTSKQTEGDSPNQPNRSIKSCYASPGNETHVLLATALVNVQDEHGNYITCRAILDNGSQVNFITEDIVQKLHLKRSRSPIPIESFNNLAYESKYNVNVQVHSLKSNFKMKLNCNVLPKVTTDLPHCKIKYDSWNIPSDLELADPGFNLPQRIDLLLGAQVFMKILLMEQQTRPGLYPVLQKTQLGWIVSGEFRNERQEASSFPQHGLFARQCSSINDQLQRFWELEEINTPAWSIEERECEEHFIANTSREEQGNYVVKLPLKQDPSTLGESKLIALHRLQRLERRLSSDKQLHEEYHKFLNEYLQLGHMQPALPTSKPTYFLPHHAVFKQDSTTTKTRVVFDASCKTSNNISLNDILKVGPVVQQDLYTIVLRFRTREIAFIADINKMYRQVKIHPSNYDCQRILWRNSPTDPVQEYQLNTVTYGTSAAPYLATRCLQKLANDEEGNYSREAIEVLEHDFYVDDCISGTNDVDSAVKLVSEMQSLLASGGFQLRKWASNSAQLLKTIPCEFQENQFSVQVTGNETVKALGLRWQPARDIFQIVSGINSSDQHFRPTRFTKRNVLATISTIFDPLGLLAPTVILCKIFMQKLWKQNLDWDDRLPSSLQQDWDIIYNSFKLLNQIHIDRFVMIKNPVQAQLHGFSDASESAFGACIYLRSCNSDGEVVVKLLCAKSRVAPLKQVSLPRLELCGAVLLARLISKVKNSIVLEISETHLWTDSSIVLAWLNKSPAMWKTFVANRVSEVQGLTRDCNWHHVTSVSNPADMVSRGVIPKELISNMLWWHGPSWLTECSSKWPTTTPIVPISGDIPEIRPAVSFVAINCSDEILKESSTLVRVQRKIAYCLRFIKNCKEPEKCRSFGPLTPTELRMSLTICVKLAQRICYPQEFTALEKGEQLSHKSAILELHPFIDKLGLLRVGGRLQNSELPFETQHQIILPPRHHLTRLIIEREHKRLMHAGPQLLINSLRATYWVPSARKIVRNILHKCIRCFRLSAKPHTQLMGSLPTKRVVPARPFLNTGVDFAGPVYIKSGSRRSKTSVKCYISVFVCLVTHAIHLELVSDLTSEAFLAALRRFVSRRGICANIYSDNGSNFIGACNELRDLYAMVNKNSTTIADKLSMDGCHWHFNPPSTPHFGGIWESAVKSMKFHIRRIVGNSALSFEEMTTFLTQAEACLNSRPLSRLSDDPTDHSYLTPGHFLVGEALTNLPDPDLSDMSVNRLSRWQRVQQLTQQLWRRWSTEYLTSLQERGKWSSMKQNLQKGTVVLIKDDQLPPLKWKLAVIEDLHPGADGLVRVVSVRTAQGATFKRPIVKICPLPAAEGNE